MSQFIHIESINGKNTEGGGGYKWTYLCIQPVPFTLKEGEKYIYQIREIQKNCIPVKWKKWMKNIYTV